MPRRLYVRLALGLAVAVGSGCGREAESDAVAVAPAQPAREAFPQPIELIPNEASVIAGLTPTVFASSQLASQFAAELAAEPQFQQAKQALDGCGLELRSFESVVIGTHADEFVVALTGSGFGEDARALCMIEAAQRLVGAAPSAEISVDDSKKIIDFPDGRVFLVNANLLVLATAGWQGQVGELIDGEGEAKPAAKHAKRELLTTVDTHAAAWLAADLPPQVAMLFNFVGVPEAAAAINLTGAVELGERARVELTAGFETDAAAQTAAAGLHGLLSKDAAAELPAALAGVLGRVNVGNVGDRVRVGLELQAGDFAALAAAAHATPAP
ncbi:hypothetical protein [Enhygromyxa salina]|uniref:Lipoprotein n=1 Tax=Enhygromyxa salina TaxID=215803 RepID=A0A2S9XPV9_9BACT|nr:hypothetical protein [Enhygromyxa salina]PRP94904.1 hypothetical protein ENSA7_77270 [Enhygromyxa salina]